MQRDLVRMLQLERATLAVAFDGIDPGELAIARRVLQAATQRLNEYISGGNQA